MTNNEQSLQSRFIDFINNSFCELNCGCYIRWGYSNKAVLSFQSEYLYSYLTFTTKTNCNKYCSWSKNNDYLIQYEWKYGFPENFGKSKNHICLHMDIKFSREDVSQPGDASVLFYKIMRHMYVATAKFGIDNNLFDDLFATVNYDIISPRSNRLNNYFVALLSCREFKYAERWLSCMSNSVRKRIVQEQLNAARESENIELTAWLMDYMHKHIEPEKASAFEHEKGDEMFL